jgi:hypothetical protein
VGYTYGNTVEQAGITASCDAPIPLKGSTKETAIMPKGPFKSKPSYYAWWMMFGAGGAGVEKLDIHPGDVVDYKVAYDGLGNYTMGVRDLKNNKSFSITQPCTPSLTLDVTGQVAPTACDPKTVEWIVERPGNSPLADFGQVKMFGNKATLADGTTHSLTDFANGNAPDTVGVFGLDMAQNGLQLDSISSPRPNGDFNVKWMAAGSPGM